MTDREAFDLLMEAFEWEDFADTYFDANLKEAMTHALRARREDRGGAMNAVGVDLYNKALTGGGCRCQSPARRTTCHA